MKYGVIFAKYCDLKNLQEPHQNGLSMAAFNNVIAEIESNLLEKLVIRLLSDKNKKMIKHLAKRKIEDCKYSAYGYYYVGNGAEGDFGSWEDWEKVLVKFTNEIIENISRQHV